MLAAGRALAEPMWVAEDVSVVLERGIVFMPELVEGSILPRMKSERLDPVESPGSDAALASKIIAVCSYST